MIHLTADTAIHLPELGRDTLVITHRSYAPPITGPSSRHMSWDQFIEAPRAAMSGCKTMVIVGLNRIITPANRTKVGSYLLRPIPGLSRISIDHTLFIGEPWRAWWHFGAVGAPFQEYTYSFLAESHWKAAQDGVRADPFSVEEIIEAGRGVIRAHGDPFHHEMQIDRTALDPKTHAAYQELKALAFEEEHTPKAIVSRLAGFAQEAMPTRSIPTLTRVFNSRHPVIRQTDLAVDDWLVSELRRVVEINRKVAQEFQR